MGNRTPDRPNPDPWSRKRLTGAALALSALLFTGGLHASGSLEIEYYDVHGSSVQEVREAMNRNGPIGNDGRRFHGYTKWRVGWKFRYAPRGASCEPTSVETSLDVVMTLPRWTRPDDAPAELEREWERYSAALKAHEDGHAEFGAAAAGEIQRRLSEMSGRSGCRALAEEMNRAGRAIIEEARSRELEYDATTRHGATQGARF